MRSFVSEGTELKYPKCEKMQFLLVTNVSSSTDLKWEFLKMLPTGIICAGYKQTFSVFLK